MLQEYVKIYNQTLHSIRSDELNIDEFVSCIRKSKKLSSHEKGSLVLFVFLMTDILNETRFSQIVEKTLEAQEDEFEETGIHDNQRIWKMFNRLF